MFEAASDFLGHVILHNDAILNARPDDRVMEYVTQGGVRVIFINPSWVFEYDTETCKNITFVRWVMIDLIRIFTFLLSCRYTLQFFGNINPYDGGFFETFYTFTQWYSRACMGILPNIFGMDSGIFFSFYLLERMESILKHIILINHFGIQF